MPAYHNMCLINCHKSSDPEPDIAPPRPLSAVVARPLSVSSPRPQVLPLASQSRVSRLSQPSLRPLSTHSHLRPPSGPPSPPGQIIIVEQRTPRTSGAALARDPGASADGRAMGVERRVSLGPRKPSRPSGASLAERPTRRLSQQSGRRSGTVVYDKDPRSSAMSVRSTRERIVIVDGSVARREYLR